MSPSRRWRRVALLGLVGLLGLIGLAGRCSDAAVMEVRAINDDLGLEVILDTCNADVSVDVEEHDDRLVLGATRHDWYRYLFGSDDCADRVRVELDAPLGSRTVEDSSGDEIPVTPP